MVVTLLQDRDHCSGATYYYPPMMDTDSCQPPRFFPNWSFGLSLCSYWLNYSLACKLPLWKAISWLLWTWASALPPTSRSKTNHSVTHVQQHCDSTWWQFPSAPKRMMRNSNMSLTGMWQTAQLLWLLSCSITSAHLKVSYSECLFVHGHSVSSAFAQSVNEHIR